MRLSLYQSVWQPWRTTRMPHAIIRSGNGRRHEVDFADAKIRVEVYSSDGGRVYPGGARLRDAAAARQSAPRVRIAGRARDSRRRRLKLLPDSGAQNHERFLFDLTQLVWRCVTS